MKKSFSLNEYVRSISDKDVEYLLSCLDEKYPGDLAYCLDYFGRNQELDRMLTNTASSVELYDFLDSMKALIENKYNRSLPKEEVVVTK